jgi:hypothetical protein
VESKLKLTFAVILLLSVNQVVADDLCPINDKIEPDMRIPEAYFTKEKAEEATSKINGIVAGTDKSYEWVTVPNSLKLIEGYILKRDALNAQGAMREYHTLILPNNNGHFVKQPV